MFHEVSVRYPSAAPVPESLVQYECDDDGVLFAIEEVRAARWDARLALPPDPACADVRIVRLTRGPVPSVLPGWLSVTLAGIAENETRYVVDGEPAIEDQRPATSRRLWA